MLTYEPSEHNEYDYWKDNQKPNQRHFFSRSQGSGKRRHEYRQSIYQYYEQGDNAKGVSCQTSGGFAK